MDHADIVIVGTGHGGAQAAIALRQQGYEGSIMMIGRDREHPYERPPLSKEYLARDKTLERIWIRKPEFWAERDITVRLGAVVTKLDPEAHTLTLAGGEKLGYGKLIWSAGGDPRRLSCPGSHLKGIFGVRDLAHADEMMALLDAGARRAVVVGGGYIGLEAASVLIKLGCTVSVIEAQPRLLARVAGEDIAEFFAAEHRARGVEIYLNSSVAAFLGEDDKLAGVRLESGEEVAADIAVVGIGIVPAVGPLIAAGAAGANGVDVDAHCRTNLPDIYAIGDCAAHANPYADGAVIRLESVQNAHDMAVTVAKDIVGEGEAYNALPWFWSNQYDHKLQTAGLAMGYDDSVLRGAPASGKFSVVYLKEGRVIAVDAVNMTRDYAQGRKLVEARLMAERAQLADDSLPLKELL